MRRFSSGFVLGGVTVLIVLLVSAEPGQRAFAQAPLGEVAKKEAERRKAQPPAAKVYTAKDLPESAQKPGPARTVEPAQPSDLAVPADGAGEAAGKVAAAEAAGSTKPAEDDKAESKNETWWKARMARVREELRRNEIFAESLQSRINALTREYALPTAGTRRAAVGDQRAEAITELGRVKQDIERGKKELADIEEEARRAGVPPGWLR